MLFRSAFVNPFQNAPLDMYSPEFYHRRRDALERRLAVLRDGSVRDLLAVYDRLRGFTNAWVNWNAMDRDLLELALTRIPFAHLEAVWRRILFDPAANRSGFPDLVVFPQTEDYVLVEVKGPGDSLQHNQKRWLRFFREHQMPAEVAFVQWH